LNPLIPHQEAGNRIDPPVSVPIAKRQDPDATLAAAPEDATHNIIVHQLRNAIKGGK
jgi:hypothetical protein